MDDDGIPREREREGERNIYIYMEGREEESGKRGCLPTQRAALLGMSGVGGSEPGSRPAISRCRNPVGWHTICPVMWRSFFPASNSLFPPFLSLSRFRSVSLSFCLCPAIGFEISRWNFSNLRFMASPLGLMKFFTYLRLARLGVVNGREMLTSRKRCFQLWFTHFSH